MFFFRNFLAIIFLLGLSSKALASTCAPYAQQLQQDREYRLTFGDSGVGGLIFMLDVNEELEKKLKKLEEKYRVKFVFDHLGDSKNAPYGAKTVDEMRNLTQNFLSYQLALPNVRTAVIACNTASTVFDQKMQQHFQEKYPEISIISMIETSAKALVDEGNKHGKNSHIAILATPATIKSSSYQNEISKISNLNLATYAPQNWVKNIESVLEKQHAETELANDLEIFKQTINQNFSQIKAVGLFCTHFPFYKKEIANFFAKNGNKSVKILTQGRIFSDQIYTDILRNLAPTKNFYHKRAKKIPANCAPDIALESSLTGDNFEEIKNIIKNTHPQYLEKISFQKIKLTK